MAAEAISSRFSPLARSVAFHFSLAAALMMCMTRVNAESFPGIQKLMGEEQFKEAGLDRLTVDQLRSLDAWLLHYTAGEAELLQTENEEVKEARGAFSLKARVQGDFRGWDGETKFYLDNGQVWRQRLSGRYHHRGSSNPEIEITVNWLGFYKMTVLESGKSVGVTLVSD